MSTGPHPRLQILLRSPEITLKGRNKKHFWARLVANTTEVIETLGHAWPVRMYRGRLQVGVGADCTRASLDEAVDALGKVAGVTSIAVAIGYERKEIAPGTEVDRDRFESSVLHYARETSGAGKTFAVRVNRVDKRFPVPSAELERWLGQLIRDKTDWDEVRLRDPDQSFHIDIYADSVFFYADKVRGVGGLPVGSSGHLVSLLSGGIDSPVASYLMARRGCSVDWLHMSAAPVSAAGLDGTVPDRLALELSRTTHNSRLFVVPYTHFDLALPGRDTGYEPILFRRFLFRVGRALAARTSGVTLVTGDSLSQVASQTLENLIATDEAIDVPVLRPLIGLDKQEIMDIAESIGTYRISIEPYKDCCALYSGRPRTRTRDRVLASIEDNELPEPEALVSASLSDAIWARYRCGQRVSVHEGISSRPSDLDAA